MATELLKPPVPGEVWVDGLDHGREWLVEAVSEQTVYLVMLHDGQRTPNRQEWPLNRWRTFLMRQGIDSPAEHGIQGSHDG